MKKHRSDVVGFGILLLFVLVNKGLKEWEIWCKVRVRMTRDMRLSDELPGTIFQEYVSSSEVKMVLNRQS